MATQSEAKSDGGKVDATTVHLDDNPLSDPENAEAVDENSSSEEKGGVKGDSTSASHSEHEDLNDDPVPLTSPDDATDGNVIQGTLSFIVSIIRLPK